MTRLFFAFIALLSGLAAVQAPAHAARQEQLAYGVQTPLQAAAVQANPACPVAIVIEQLPHRRAIEPAHRWTPFPEHCAARVLVGIDQALE